MGTLVVGLVIHGEPYSPSPLPYSYTHSYTGRYSMWSLAPGTLVTNSLWVGVQLPQYQYTTRGRVYITPTVICNTLPPSNTLIH